MGARSKARKRALDVLYEADLMGADLRETLQHRIAQAAPPMPGYAVELVEGVLERRAAIDALISAHAEEWSIERMPGVDRAVLRLGTYELIWRDEVPDAVVISEAVELARTLSTDDSPRFVNGVLARLAAVGRDHDAVRSGEDVDGAPGVRGQDAPVDELLGEQMGGLVVDDRE